MGLDAAFDAARNSLRALDPFQPLFVVPVFLGYTLGSFASLRKWAAVQRAPIAPPGADDADAPPTPRCPSICPLTIVQVVQIASFAKWAGWGTLAPSIVAFLGIVFLYADFCRVTLRDLLGVPAVIHRTPDGGWKYTLLTNEMTVAHKLAATAVLAIASAVPVGAFWYSSDVCASAMIFVVVYSVTSQPRTKTSTLRVAALNAIAAVTVMTFAATLFAAAIHLFGLSGAAEIALRQGPGTWIYALALALPLGDLLAICLRLDYANSASAIDASAPLLPSGFFDLQIAAVPSASAVGVRVPPRMPAFRTFPRPYFTGALGAWGLASAGVGLLTSAGALPDHRRLSFAFFVLVGAAPAVLLAILAVGAARGEVRRVWQYEERWGVVLDEGGRADALEKGGEVGLKF
ncbi:hypothetical protein HWV62_25346 [Athelia sp. TMB]|nr:hypothetical protein HWV62_25346 [Athelia sp. TMB]